ncbi:alcohol dehydrogenase [Gracilimonas mengyeensis]|uniref:Alcohol dehydrogenase, propanol-preferring n=1 Tax=Gracilimonas mengyeensis TaxID=1302730 RepID=A0A521E1S2_9BACT|nr:alcohol dehydrogenase [Gracilimonas mengyeensis]SMO77904.1 alcohol dehydrogenase, propanol-preferring [Gracilimonas mengyeensis]
MKAVQVSEKGGDFEVVERDIPQINDDQVLIKVQACGVCHSDQFVKDGVFPGLEYPRVPGHEVVGIIEKTGANVSSWKEGQRVGVGWHGGHCFECEPCRRGDFINCKNAKITGISFDGGYQEYMAAPQEALAMVPENLESADAAPLLCAGVTVFNALRNTEAQAGDLVAIQGIGGLGHLGIQYAHKMGFKTVAISGSRDKEKLAKELGADAFLSMKDQDVVEELQKMGGAKVILATAPSSDAVTAIFEGLGPNGTVVAVGADMQPVELATMQFITGKKTLTGHASGTAMDSEDTLNFSALSKSTPMIETYPLEKAAEAYDRMIKNEARFRTVLVMD